MTLLAVVLMAACTDDKATDNELPMPEGMGRISITICTPEQAGGQHTRAVGNPVWEDPDHDWEKLQSVRILICDASTNNVVQIIEKKRSELVVESTPNVPDSILTEFKPIVSEPLTAGIPYKIYATANFHSDVNTGDAYNDGFAVGSTVDANATFKFTNGYSEKNIPMTGRLNDDTGKQKNVTPVNNVVTPAGIITLWRVMGKMQFEFTNETSKPVKIIGVEVEPINLATSGDNKGVYVFSKDNLSLEDNLEAGTTHDEGKYGVTLPSAARTDVGTVRYEPATALTLAAKDNTSDGDEGSFFFYVNETDATFTTTENQLSLRFKVQRQKPGTTGANAGDWFTEEMRYGMTTPYTDGSTGGNGFNVIRRNDWIHIPIHLTDWQFRVEPLAYPPIAGYPAATVSSDGLTTTFSTGGPIILQPFAQKNNDGTWLDFTNPEVTFQSITWKNSNGTDVVGTGNILESGFTYDDTNGTIIGVLNNNLSAGTYKTSVTINVKLGPQGGPQYDHAFTFNVVLSPTTP